MSKLRWLFAIVICIFIGYLILSKLNPEMGWGIDNVLGGTIGSIKTGIEATPLWQQYDVWFSAGFFTIVTAIIMWKGHNAYNRVRGTFVKSAQRETGYQIVPTAQPMTIQQAPVAQPQVTPTPVVAPEIEKKETSA